MKVTYVKTIFSFHGVNETTGDPIIIEDGEEVIHGEVIGHYLSMIDINGHKREVPHFILSLDDGSFTSAPISECTRIEKD